MSNINKNSEKPNNQFLDDPETQERINKNTLLYPIAKAFLYNYPPPYDIINSYDKSIEDIPYILDTESNFTDKTINTNVNNVLFNFSIKFTNVRVYSPNTAEFIEYSTQFSSTSSPLDALKFRNTYCLLILCDTKYSYNFIKIDDGNYNTTQTKVVEFTIPNSYAINIPMPIGSKYCVTRTYDPLTLIKTGEDFDGLNGLFIISGFLKYLIGYYNKPYSKPIILKNLYENQLSRSEGLYSTGLDYANSYYLLASMLKPNISHVGRVSKKMLIPDFIFSLQFEDNRMNRKTEITRKKSLYNRVPIKYLFYAFGCGSDKEMMTYIDPDMEHYGLIHAVRLAVLQGHEHIGVLKDAGISYTLQNDCLVLDEPLNPITAKWIVGNIILCKEYKKQISDRCKGNQKKYHEQIIEDVDDILLHNLMPGIGHMTSDMTLYDKKRNGTLTPEELNKLNEQINNRNKAVCYELGTIVRKLYNIGNDIEESMDKTSLLNKRIRLGQQIKHEFKGFNNQRLRELKSDIERKVLINYKNFESLTSSKFEKEFHNFIISFMKTASTKQSLSILNTFKGTVNEKTKMRTNLLTPKNQGLIYNELREVVISNDSKTRGTTVQWEHRAVHPSHYFFIDPVHCPESGTQVGRYQMPTLYTFLTTGTIGKGIYEYIKKFPGYKSDIDTLSKNYMIRLNGSVIGYIAEYEPVEDLYNSLLEIKSKNLIEKDATIVLNNDEGILDIWTDEGRLNSLFVNVKYAFDIERSDKSNNERSDKSKSEDLEFNYTVKPKESFLKWLKELNNNPNLLDEGLKNRFVELLTPDMVIYNTVIAGNITEFYNAPQMYSHLALPEHLLSYVTSLNPCGNFNAGVRASYSSNHMKQSMGASFRYPMLCYLNENNVPLANQIPFIRPVTYDMMRFNEKPMGCNVLVAFLVMTDNQEDSFIINRSSVEEGLFVINTIQTISAQCEKHAEEFGIPSKDMKKNGNLDSYEKINPDTSLPKNIGDKFYTNDVLIAKKIKIENKQEVDTSILNEKVDGFHPLESNTRELIYIVNDADINNNTTFKSAVFGQRKNGVNGDKFSSCNAQKGTIGRIYNSDMMPYTESGLKPDIIFNPPSVFSRNTLGQVYEPVVSKLAALCGCPLDATPYATLRSLDEIEEIYKKLGLNPQGYENLYNPNSGRLIGKVFLATMQYQRQQHMTENKLNIRWGNGDFDKIFQIPVKGRKKSGGQSCDRMSNDSIIGAGCMELLKDIHLNQGAKMKIAVCNKCHKQYTYYSLDHSGWVCSKCGKHTDFTVKEIIPVENLINHVLTGLHICFEIKDETSKTQSETLSELVNEM